MLPRTRKFCQDQNSLGENWREALSMDLMRDPMEEMCSGDFS